MASVHFYNFNLLIFHACLILLFLINSIPFCSSNSQNIEIFYPTTPPPSSPPPSHNVSPISPPPPEPVYHKTSRKAIATAVGVTAASTIVAAALLFFLCTAYAGHGKKDEENRERTNLYAACAGGVQHRQQPVAESEFKRFDGNVKGLIVDEDGLDVLYWRKLEGSQRKSGPFHKEVFTSHNKPPSGRRNFPRGKSSSSSSPSVVVNNQVHPKDDQTVKLLDSKLPSSSDRVKLHDVENSANNDNNNNNPPVEISQAVPVAVTLATPPPPPVVKAPPPLPPPMMGKKGPPPPPPPRMAKGASGSSRPPLRVPAAKMSAAGMNDASEDKNDQVKMKPLHWEKVNVVNRDHSMVWDKLDRGSFQYNGDMMEALFGTVAANKKSPKATDSTTANKPPPTTTTKISILDSRRSQNIAIVIRSLGISRRELIDGLSQGNGLSIEILEKLTRMSPTREEKLQIVSFNGEVGNLADAESFLYHLLTAVPSAFTRVNAMLFRHTYGSEIQHLKDTIQTLDSACNELRNRGVFLKLLEAILKAGNRLNAGTARGDANAFNLTALRKLSDYKSSDEKTTLLHFVVHEVVRNEGRRCVMNRNNSLSRSNSQKTANTAQSSSKEDQEKEFLKLGLPVVGGLSSEFTNVKKSASIDHDSFASIIPSLESRIAETRQLVLQCGGDNSGVEFINSMKEFLSEAEGEVKTVKDEQIRVMEFIKKTTQYYQSGGFKEKQPLQMFSIVKDFLGMVDKACIDITRSLQQKKGGSAAAAAGGSSASSSSQTDLASPDVLRTRVTFPRLPDHFLSEKFGASDSDDDR